MALPVDVARVGQGTREDCECCGRYWTGKARTSNSFETREAAIYDRLTLSNLQDWVILGMKLTGNNAAVHGKDCNKEDL